MLATLTIRGQLPIEVRDLLALYQDMERTIKGSQGRMLLQLEQKGWPVPRSSVFDEFNNIRRQLCNGILSVCLQPIKLSSTGSSAS